MPVPSWSPIADSEIDPESPITASLMQRLRDSWAAVLGVDPESLTKPVVPYPQSQLCPGDFADMTVIPTGTGTFTTSEVVAFDIASAFEHTTVPTLRFSYWNNSLSQLEETLWRPSSLELIYTASVPSGVKINFARQVLTSPTGGTSGTMAGANTSYTAPFDNAYHLLLAGRDSSTRIEMKARATSTTVYIQFRFTRGTHPSSDYSYGWSEGAFERTVYKAKA